MSECIKLTCSECPHWQGSKYSKWGDCNYVVGKLYPELFKLPHAFMEGIYFTVPFDPHHTKYYDPALKVFIKNCAVPFGVRKEKVKEQDIWFDEMGGERVRKVWVYYFQTRYDWGCEKWNTYKS